jgi:hypothetical protein
MFRLKHALFVVALTSLASAGVVPAYAHEGPETKGSEGETAAKTEKAKPACSADELSSFLAAVKAEQAAKAAKAKREAAAKHVSKNEADKHLTAEGSPEPGSDARTEAEKAAKHEAEKKAEAARKAEKAKQRAAEEKARVQKYLEKACANAKAEAAARAKKEADRKARARKFQAIGVVAVTDGEAGTVTVFIKAGSPDLHKRKLAIRVTSETVIKLDGVKVPLAGLVSGTYVSVHGVRSEGTLVAAKINAASPGIQEDEPAPSPTVTATAAPAEAE